MKPTGKTAIGATAAVGSGLVAWRSLFPWLIDDIKMLRANRRKSKAIKEDLMKKRFVVDMFEEAVARTPDKPFIIFEDREYSYRFMDQQANRVANIAYNWRLRVGDTVAIMFTNEPAFVWTFLGFLKLGLAVSFINHHTRGKPLVHSIVTSGAKALILGEEESLLQCMMEIKTELGDLPVYVSGRRGKCPDGFLDWTSEMETVLPAPVSKEVRKGIVQTSHCCYIFTSGTTGLPKPCIVTMARALSFANSYQVQHFTSEDILYTTTPFYHSAASGLGIMNVLERGATMVLKRKFSARQYWKDVRRHKVTVLQYIGELCRYLLAVPPDPLDGVHNVRCAIGNGLRPDIWLEFKERFGIPDIYEFFGATEGTLTTINVSNKLGACGRASPLLQMLEDVSAFVVKCDLDTGELYRDKNGRCIKVKPGETGMVLAGMSEHYKQFQFYRASRDENMKKVVQNAFKPGDTYFCFGDLLYLDKDYFLYFRDRVGDTFRWKGENVSTFEVANVLVSMDLVHDANVYGVKVPDSYGRAGMAALYLKGKSLPTKDDLAEIYHHCVKNLPSYARPVFLRFPTEVNETTTFKHRKVEYVKQGYDSSVVTDALFYKDDSLQTYSPLTLEAHSLLTTKSRL